MVQEMPRMTLTTLLVLRAMLDDPTREMYGLEICDAAGLASGTIHPLLARLQRFGWVESRWEDVDPHDEGRPRRRYYRLNPDGAAHARQAIAAKTSNATTLRRLLPGTVEGLGLA